MLFVTIKRLVEIRILIERLLVVTILLLLEKELATIPAAFSYQNCLTGYDPYI